uniref:Uncharacterized protein n=1 Tax=Strongyloides venezuelensis TaxID=75913 RepID=A0A0K0G697_STRVS
MDITISIAINNVNVNVILINKRIYNAYCWPIKNNSLYENDVLSTLKDFDKTYVQAQFTFVDDVSTKRQEIIKKLDKSMRKKINRKANKNLTEEV